MGKYPSPGRSVWRQTTVNSIKRRVKTTGWSRKIISYCEDADGMLVTAGINISNDQNYRDSWSDHVIMRPDRQRTGLMAALSHGNQDSMSHCLRGPSNASTHTFSSNVQRSSGRTCDLWRPLQMKYLYILIQMLEISLMFAPFAPWFFTNFSTRSVASGSPNYDTTV